MAVSPIGKDGKVDNDTVYFAYAGTNPKEPADLGTDVQLGLSGISNKQVETNPKKFNIMGSIVTYLLKKSPENFLKILRKIHNLMKRMPGQKLY